MRRATRMLGNRELWWSVLKNVRAGIMPPAGKPRPSDKELGLLADWIKRDVLGADPRDPDPGPRDDSPLQPGRVSQHGAQPDRFRFQGGGGISARRHGLRVRHDRRRALGLAALAREVHASRGIDRGGRGSDRVLGRSRGEGDRAARPQEMGPPPEL